MAPAHPPGGRALSAVGDGALDHPHTVADPAAKDPGSPGEGWQPISGERPHVSHATAARVSPDPLRTTDRYRLVTPFKLKL